MKNATESVNNIVDKTEKIIYKLKISHWNDKIRGGGEKRIKKNEEELCDIWETIKYSYMHYENFRRKRERKGAKSLFKEMMAKYFIGMLN